MCGVLCPGLFCRFFVATRPEVGIWEVETPGSTPVTRVPTLAHPFYQPHHNRDYWPIMGCPPSSQWECSVLIGRLAWGEAKRKISGTISPTQPFPCLGPEDLETSTFFFAERAERRGPCNEIRKKCIRNGSAWQTVLLGEKTGLSQPWYLALLLIGFCRAEGTYFAPPPRLIPKWTNKRQPTWAGQGIVQNFGQFWQVIDSPVWSYGEWIRTHVNITRTHAGIDGLSFFTLCVFVSRVKVGDSGMTGEMQQDSFTVTVLVTIYGTRVSVLSCCHHGHTCKRQTQVYTRICMNALMQKTLPSTVLIKL